jgi:hypothetical protein
MPLSVVDKFKLALKNEPRAVVDKVKIGNSDSYYWIGSGNTVNPLVGFVAGVYYPVPPLGLPARLSAPYYDDQYITFPAVDTVFTKRFGYRGQLCTISLLTVQASKADCEGSKVPIWEQLNSLERINIIIPGQVTLAGCKYVQNSFTIDNVFTFSKSMVQLFSFQVNVLDGAPNPY